MAFYFEKWFGASSGFLLGVVYVLLVPFVPYGVVGTWRLRGLQWREAWRHRLQSLGTGRAGKSGEQRRRPH